MKKYSIIFSVVFTIFVLLPRTSFASSLEIVGQSSNTGTNKTIYYYVDSATYGSLSATVDQFVSDVSRDTGSSYKVFKVVVNNPGDIRATLKEGYEKENLWGAFLIGRISPFTYFGQTDLYGLPMITEHFYEALYFPVNYVSDGLIKQPHVSSNLLPSYHSQIWLGIIYPSKSGIDGTNQIKHYLDRNHSYRLGQLTYQQRMYFSDSIGIGEFNYDYNYFSNFLSGIFAEHPLYKFGDIVLSAATDPNLQKSDFLSALNSNYEMLYLNVHGTPSGIFFSGANSSGASLTSTELPANASSPKYIEMVSCGTGHFTQDDYFAGKLLFDGDTLLVTAATEPILFSNDYVVDELNQVYYALGLGASFADIYVPLMGDQGALNFFGDPTLKFRAKPAQNIPKLTVSGAEEIGPSRYLMDFGTVYDNSSKTLWLTLSNSGSAPLLIKGFMVSSLNSYNDLYSIGGSSGGFLFSITDYPGQLELNESIEPGGILSLSFKFDPGVIVCYGQTCSNPWLIGTPQYGHYDGIFSLFTSDPSLPAFNLLVRGNNSTHNCDATLSPDFKLHIPFLTFYGQSYWADFSYVPNTMNFELTNAGIVSEVSTFAGCLPTTLSNDLSLHIPAVIFYGASYWLDMIYGGQGATLTYAGAGQN